MVSRSTFGVIMTAILVLPSILPAASATVIFVNTTGWWFEGGELNASPKPLQDAIHNASQGDMVRVDSGEYGCVIVDRSLSFIGDGYPVINGTGCGTAVNVTSDGVTLSGFIITSRGDYESGIKIEGSNITVEDSMVTNCTDYGIMVTRSTNVSIRYCQILKNRNVGVTLSVSRFITIEHSTIAGNGEYGIEMYNTFNSSIFNNTLDAIDISESAGNTIYFNDLNGAGFDVSKPPNRWYSPVRFSYTYNGSEYAGYLGNYWNGSENFDGNGDGIGDYTYSMNSNNSDPYPLFKPRNYYTILNAVGDSKPPLITSVNVDPQLQNPDGFVNVTCNVYDDTGVGVVVLNLTHPDMTVKSFIMDHLSGSLYYFNTSYSLPGVYRFFIQATDVNGNENVSEVYTFTIRDTAPPLIDILSPKGIYKTTTVWLNVTADEEVSRWWYSLDGGANTSFSPNTTITAGEGEHEIEVYANDTNGNIGNATSTFSIDLTPPPAITNLSFSTGSTWIRWFWSNPPVEDFNCTLIYIDGELRFCANSDAFELIGLQPSTTHTISTRTVDRAGNINDSWINSSATTLGPTVIFVNTTGWWFEGEEFMANSTPIQAAIDNAPEMSIIHVLSGSYNEAVTVYKTLTIWGEGSLISAPPLDSGFNSTVFKITANNVTLDGLHIVGDSNSKGILIYYADGCEIVNTTVFVDYLGGSERVGIHVYHSDRCTIKNNTISVSGFQSKGIYGVYSNSTVMANNIVNASGDSSSGILVYGGYGVMYNNEVTSDGYGVFVYYSPHVTIENNSITSFSSWEVAIAGAFDGVFKNNTISDVKTSLKCRGNVKLRGVDRSNRPPDPPGFKNISMYLEINETDGWAVVNMTYPTYLTESGLELWRYSDGWQRYGWGEKILDTERNIVGGNITSSGIFAPLLPIEDDTPPAYIVVGENRTTASAGESVEVYAFWEDENPHAAWLETNQTIDGLNFWHRISELQLNGWSNFTITAGEEDVGKKICWKIYANDTAGNVNSTETRCFYVVPVLSIVSYNPDQPVVHSTEGDLQVFNLSLNQVADVEWYVNGTIVQRNNSVNFAEFSAIAQAGTWRVVANATNRNGRDEVGWTWIVEANVPPAIELRYATVVEKGEEANLTVRIIDSDPYAFAVYRNGSMIMNGRYSGEFNVSINTSTVGRFNYTVWANDTAGNYNITSVLITVQDTTPPTLSYLPPTPSGSVSGGSVTISVESNEEIRECILQWNGINESFAPNNKTCTIEKPVKPGEDYVFNLYAVDLSNNTGSAGERSFSVVKPASTPPEYPVININTGKGYPSIADAIADTATTDGHTIEVKEGRYSGFDVSKSLRLVASGKVYIIGGVRLSADHASLAGFVLSSPLRVDGNQDEVRECEIDTGDSCILLNGEAARIHGNVLKNCNFAIKGRSVETAIEGNTMLGNNVSIDVEGENITMSGNLLIGRVTPELFDLAREKYPHVLNFSEIKVLYGDLKWLGDAKVSSVGMRLEVSRSTISNNIIFSYSTGIAVEGASNTLNANVVVMNGFGIRVFGNDNLIYNNFFDNEKNVESDSSNRWNLDTPLRDRNILGGLYTGGNYWSDYRGADKNGDGLGDEPYRISEREEDRYPMVMVSYQVINLNTSMRYPTIQSAVDEAQNGEHILVNSGRYEENVVVNKSVTILSNGTVFVIAHDSSKPVFDVRADNITLKGFIVYGSSVGVRLQEVENCRIVENRVRESGIGIMLLSSTTNLLTSNQILDNEIGVSLNSSRQNKIYNNFFSNRRNVAGNGSGNIWNAELSNGVNVVGGSRIGGNYWSDYGGRDVNYDGIGDSPYLKVGDSYPLVIPCRNPIQISSNEDFRRKALFGSGVEHDPFIIEGCRINSSAYPNIGTAVSIENTDAFFELRDSIISAYPHGLYLKNVGNGRISNVQFSMGVLSSTILVENSRNVYMDNCTFRPLPYTVDSTTIKIVNSTRIDISTARIAGYETGMHIVSSNDVVVENSRISADTFGMIVESASDIDVLNVSVTGSEVGIKITSSSNVNLRRSFLSDNYLSPFCGQSRCGIGDAYDGESVAILNSNHVSVTNSSILHSYNGISLSGSDEVTISDCTIAHNAHHGISSTQYSDNVRISSCEITHNHVGIWLNYIRNSLIKSSYITGNTYGINVNGPGRGYGNLIYNNYFENNRNLEGSGEWWNLNNSFNITKTPGRNIIGGPYLGGNYWSDYNGYDLDGDKLGDVPYAYGRVDMHPLMNLTAIHIRSNDEFTAENGVTRGSGTVDDPYVIENKDITASATHGIWIENTTAHFIIRNVNVTGNGRSDGILLQNVSNGSIENATVSGTRIGVHVLNSHGVVISASDIRKNNYGVLLNSSDVAITNCRIHNNHYRDTSRAPSEWFGGGVLAISSTVSMSENTLSSEYEAGSRSDFGVHAINSSVTFENNTISGYHYCVKGKNSTETVYENSLRCSYGVFAKGGKVSISKNLILKSMDGVHIEDVSARITDNRISGIMCHFKPVTCDTGNGVFIHSSSVIVSNNTILLMGKYGIYAESSSLGVSKNVFRNDIRSVFLSNSYGVVANNLMEGGEFGVIVEGDPFSNLTYPSIYVIDNTIINATTGVLYRAEKLSSRISHNRIHGSEKAILLENAGRRNIDNNALYDNIYDVYATNSDVQVNSIYSLNLSVHGVRLGNKPVLEWDKADFGSNILRAAILGIESTQFGISKEVGDLMSVHVHADSTFGLTRERLYMIDRVNNTVIELYSNSISGKSVDKAIAIPIIKLNDSVYDLYYEVTNSAGDRAYSLVRVEVKNLNLEIVSVTTTFAKRIYSPFKMSTPQYKVTPINKFPKFERGSFVNVTVKNNGSRGGFAKLEVVLPDYLHDITPNPVAYLYLNASEERTYTFYVLLSHYDNINGWTPKPSDFPSDKKIPVTVRLHNYPSYTLADSENTTINFKFGPIFKIGSYRDDDHPYTFVVQRDPNHPERPYDGDGDGELEAAEGHHFNLYIVNIGDEPANITMLVYQEVIPCNASQYIHNRSYRYSEEYIMHNSPLYTREDDYLSYPIQDRHFYAPYPFNDDTEQNDNKEILFGMLYPENTPNVSSYYLWKDFMNGWIDWWPDVPSEGIYPPASYTGKMITRVIIGYSDGEAYDYIAPSINTIPIQVKALQKSFSTITYSTSDISLRIYSIDPEKGTVHMTMKNLNDYVFFEYRSDGFYGNWEGYKWYHVLPPEDTFNLFAKDARDPDKSIPHLKVMVGAKWSAWANSLKLGMMTLEAVVNTLLDEATGGAIQVEFADNVMSTTKTLLELMNAVESIQNGVTPVVKIDGVVFTQEDINDLANRGLNTTYFTQLKRGEIDTGMAATFIKAAYHNKKVRKVFEREIIKAVIRNLGLEDIYNQLNDPEIPEDKIEEIQDRLLEYLVENKKLTKEQAENIEDAAEVVGTFIDIGEWVYYNLNSEGMRVMTINILDPPSNYSVAVEESEMSYFGSYLPSENNAGNGSVTVEYLNDSFVRVTGIYTLKSEDISLPIDKIKRMAVRTTGKRVEGEMLGDTVMEIIPQPSEMLNLLLAFRNPDLPRALVATHFARVENISTIAEGDRVVVHATGILRASSKDLSFYGEVNVNDSGVFIKIVRTLEANGSLAFGPVAGIPTNSTVLKVVHAGRTEYFDHLPDRLVLKAEAFGGEQRSVEYSIVLLAILIAALAVLGWRRLK